MTTVIVTLENNKFEFFPDMECPGCPGLVAEALAQGSASRVVKAGVNKEFTNRFVAVRNDGPQVMPIERVGERIIATHYPDGRVRHKRRYVAPGGSRTGGGGFPEISYTDEEKKLLDASGEKY